MVGEAGELETRQERAVRRTVALRTAFQTVFETLADIYRDEDWRYVNDANDRPYNGFTAFVADQLGCASSNARRYQQGIVGLILPLQELVSPGARVPVTSADVARLGVAGARVVIEEAQDALQGITHVIRGQDLFEAAHIQRLLQVLLGLPEPVYRHHRLLTADDGRRLAKRDRAEALRDLRGRGVTAEDLRAELGV